MKRNWKKRLSVILMIAVLIVSFEVIGVSAAAPAAPGNLTAVPTYEGVNLRWDYASGATRGYDVYVDGVYNGHTDANTYKVSGLNPYSQYTFTVWSLNAEGNSYSYVNAQPVRPMTYRIKVKANATLNTHNGVGGALRIKRGQTIEATHFSSGKYMFYNNGGRYYMTTSRARSVQSVYMKKGKWNYTPETAEAVVNDRGLTSETDTLIWVSTYTQHVYYFKNMGGRWVAVDDWECCTGKAKEPTPTGVTNVKRIWKKVRTRHGFPFWSPFSSMNSFHSVGRSAKSNLRLLGNPASSGCVRNAYDKAKLIYNDAKVGTTVFVY